MLLKTRIIRILNIKLEPVEGNAPSRSVYETDRLLLHQTGKILFQLQFGFSCFHQPNAFLYGIIPQRLFNGFLSIHTKLEPKDGTAPSSQVYKTRASLFMLHRQSCEYHIELTNFVNIKKSGSGSGTCTHKGQRF